MPTGRLPAILTALLFLVSCRSTGVYVSQQQMAAFEKGKTTYAEVIQALGEPTSNTVNEAGQRMIVYAYTQVEKSAVNYIPVVGALAGSTSARSSKAMLRFDSHGILVAYTSNESGKGRADGPLPSGVPDGTVENQPRQAGQ